MPNQHSKSINDHQYPRIFFKYPFLLRLQHLANCITTLRVWYVGRRLKKIVAKLDEPFKLLDAGFGAGDFILPLCKKFSKSSFFALDRSESNVLMTKAFSKKYRLNNLNAAVANLEEPLSESDLDAIICITVLQYVEKDEETLKNWFHALKNGGVLLIYLPIEYKRIFTFYETVVQKKMKDVDYDQQQGIQRRYTGEKVKRLLSKSGFQIQEEEYSYGIFGKIAFELYSIQLVFIKKFSKILIPLWLIVLTISYPIILVLMLLDFIFKNKTGNGILISAIKP